MLALVLIAALVVIVWTAVFATRGSLLAGCCVLIVITACLGHPFFHTQLGPLTVTLDRLLLPVLLLAYAVQWRLGRTDPKPVTRSEVVLVALVALLTISTFTHDWNVTLPDQVPPIWRLIAGYLVPAIVYWIARQSPLTDSGLSKVYACFALVGVYLGATGMAEIAQQWWLVFPKHIADPEVGLHFGRARGPMVQGPTYGLYVGVCMICAWAWSQRNAAARMPLVLAALPILLGGVFFSYTRSVWMGAGLGLFIALALTLRGHTRRMVLGCMVVAALLVGATKYESIIGIQREGSFSASRDSAYMRASFTYVSWKMFLDRPLLGCGFGHFPTEKLPYLADRTTQRNLQEIRPLSHHNTFLSLLTETGIVGLVLFIVLLGCWVRDAWRLYRSPISPPWAKTQGMMFLGAFGVYAPQLMFHELTFSPMDNLLVFFFAGITSGLVRLAGVTAAVAAPVATANVAAWPGAAPSAPSR